MILNQHIILHTNPVLAFFCKSIPLHGYLWPYLVVCFWLACLLFAALISLKCPIWTYQSFTSIYLLLSTAFATSAIALTRDVLWESVVSLELPSGPWRIQILPWWCSSMALNVVIFIFILVNACACSASLPLYLRKYFPCRFLCCILAVVFQRLFSFLFNGLHVSNPFYSNKILAAHYNSSPFSFLLSLFFFFLLSFIMNTKIH